MPALVHAVHAGHAAAVIDAVVFHVDARSLAAAGAEVALHTLVRVDDGLEPRPAGHEAQHRAHGTDGVAVGASAAPGQHGDDHESDHGDEEGRQTLHPHRGFIESIAVDAFGHVGQQIVSPSVERGEQILRDASVGAVGGEQGRQRADARHERNDEERQHAPAQPTLFRRIAEAVTTLFRASAQPGNDVLHHAQRTNDRTIYAPEDQGQGDKKHDDSHIQRQHGGQELDACHPAQPGVHRPREVEEEQRDAGEEDDGQRQSDFT